MIPTQVEQGAAEEMVNESPRNHAFHISAQASVFFPVTLQSLGCQEPLLALTFESSSLLHTHLGWFLRQSAYIVEIVVSFPFLLLLSYLCVSRENNLLFAEDRQWLFFLFWYFLAHA